MVAPRFERALVALASHAQQLDGRIDRLERQLTEAAIEIPTHDDVLDVRMHSARVASDLARVTIELRAEIEDRIAASAARESRLRNLAETIADLSDSLDTHPEDWAASA
jgi:hypothetical protein